MGLDELRAKFSGGAAPTPENQYSKLKAENEAQRIAIRTARARAARYNMTLRALALKSSQDQKKIQESDREKLQAAQEAARKYNATSRALMAAAGRPTRKEDIDNLGAVMSVDATPMIAQELMGIIAVNEMTVDEINASAGDDEEIDEEETDDEEETVDDGPEPKIDPGFELENINKALKENKPEEISRAILLDFLETHAPHEIATLDEKLLEYKGRELELFDYFTNKYTTPGDAEAEGIIKAEEEVVGKEGVGIDAMHTSEAPEAVKEREEAYKKTIAAAEEGGKKLEEVKEDAERRKSKAAKMESELKKYEKVVDKESVSVAPVTAAPDYIVGGKVKKESKTGDAPGAEFSIQVAHLKLMGLEKKEAEAAKAEAEEFSEFL